MSLKWRFFLNLLSPTRPNTWLLGVVWSREFSRHPTRQQSKKFLYIRLLLMFLVLFSNQRGLFSDWGALFSPLRHTEGDGAPEVVSDWCQQWMPLPDNHAFSSQSFWWSFSLWWFAASLYVPRDLRAWRIDQFISQVFIHECAVCSPVASAVCLNSQLEKFWPPCPVVRDCWWIQSPDGAGYSKHLYMFGMEFFNLSLLELCKSEVSGL